MQTIQQLNKPKFFHRASSRQRIVAGLVFLALAAFFTFLAWAAHNKINIYPYPCGFKQDYDLPCPTCGMTTSAVAFAQGRIFQAFYIQPTAALLCCVLVLSAFFTFLTAVFGIYCRFFTAVKIKYVILAIIIIIAAGWMVTLARALAEKGQV
ncbi:MAG: DUF2752 domain-containing protein [Planctomycetes bacterium]|nr:DUF2752 domain-containing protein [Planctomycetota bacterium]